MGNFEISVPELVQAKSKDFLGKHILSKKPNTAFRLGRRSLNYSVSLDMSILSFILMQIRFHLSY